jgi:multicomponent Na+:H+ antiporter subunit E
MVPRKIIKKKIILTDLFVLIVLLWLFWIVVSDDSSSLALLSGLVISITAALAAHIFLFAKKDRVQKSIKEYIFAVEHLFALLFTTTFRLTVANAVVIYQAITLRIHPRIVKIKVNVRSDFEINLISTLITLTPGTLVIDVEDAEEGGSYLYVHFSYLKTDDPQKYIENTIGKWDAMIGALFT